MDSGESLLRNASGAMAFNGSKKIKRPVRGGIIAALDVGTTKVCCFIARVEERGALRIIGIGHQVSRGLRAGTIVDMDAAEHAIGTTVHTAEQMAGETIREVIVNISGGQPMSQTANVEVPIGGHEANDADVRRALLQARQFQGSADQ